jgi:drug/metabolite transporter (DMT)-like permease
MAHLSASDEDAVMKAGTDAAAETSSPPARGYVMVALAAIMWAGGGTAAKYLFNRGTTAFDLIQLRTSLSFIGLFGWLVLTRPGLLRISPRDLPYFLALGTFGIAAAQFFYLFAISKISVAAAILLHYTGPLFIFLYKLAFTREKLKASTALAMAATIVGCALVVEAYDPQVLAPNRIGVIGGLLAAMAFATYSLLSEHGMRRYPPWTVLAYAMLFAAVAWNTLHAPLAAFATTRTLTDWGWVVFIAVVGTILPFGFYFKGIHRIRSTHAAITATLEPVSAGVIAFLFLGEILAPAQILGGLIVLAAIIYLQRRPQPPGPPTG